MNRKTPIKLNYEKFRDHVYACWIGKNIGGTMGTPFEGKREMQDISGFTSAPGKPLPNDDLDLQLVWLHAMESAGPKAISASLLGEYWLSFIGPNWNEYGIGKNNMRRGLIPPLSGDHDNSWKNSNGAWIRTEVWACMAPGCPDLAASYAIEDAKVDHGSGEGTFAAAFVAAMQSAAFVVKDINKCIEIGLAEIPDDCRMADSIRLALKCYADKVPIREARNMIQQRNADIGDGWFEAPSNVAYAILGLLYGEGDFKKSMIYAINCGDDTDCTGATVGATLGILGGSNAIPTDWKEYIGDEIVTISIIKGHHLTSNRLPTSCVELTERVVAQAPGVLSINNAYVELTNESDLIPEDVGNFIYSRCNFKRISSQLKEYTMHFDSPLFYANVYLSDSPVISPLDERKITVYVHSNYELGDILQNIEARWWLPDGFTVEGRSGFVLTNHDIHGDAEITVEYLIKAPEKIAISNRCVLELCALGRPTPMYIPITLLG